MTDKVNLKFIYAPGEGKLTAPEHQAELWEITHKLREYDPKLSCEVFVQDADATPVTNLGQIAIAIGPAIVGTVGVVMGAWFHSRFGRKVRVKIGEVEVEASSVEEVTELLDKALAIDQASRGE